MKQHLILIADDDYDLVASLEARCRAAGRDVLTAHDGFTALDLIRRYRPAMAVLDVNMPGGTGLSVCEMVASDASLSDMTLAILTGEKDRETIRRCHDACAYYVPKGGEVWDRLGPLLEDHTEVGPVGPTGPAAGTTAPPKHKQPQVQSGGQDLQGTFDDLGWLDELIDTFKPQDQLAAAAHGGVAPPPEFLGIGDAPGEDDPPWVLCIDDDPDFSLALKLRLEDAGIAVVRAFNGSDGVRTAFSRPADAILLDFEMPGGRGDYVLRRLRDNPVTAEVPVFVITGRKGFDVRRTMLNLGANEFLTKPLNTRDLLAKLGSYIDVLQPA